jgi:hypothetical protein
VLGQAWVYSDTGQVVATGTLGRMHGARALRLHAGAGAPTPASGGAPRPPAAPPNLPVPAPAADGIIGHGGEPT